MLVASPPPALLGQMDKLSDDWQSLVEGVRLNRATYL